MMAQILSSCGTFLFRGGPTLPIYCDSDFVCSYRNTHPCAWHGFCHLDLWPCRFSISQWMCHASMFFFYLNLLTLQVTLTSELCHIEMFYDLGGWPWQQALLHLNFFVTMTCCPCRLTLASGLHGRKPAMQASVRSTTSSVASPSAASTRPWLRVLLLNKEHLDITLEVSFVAIFYMTTKEKIEKKICKISGVKSYFFNEGNECSPTHQCECILSWASRKLAWASGICLEYIRDISFGASAAKI